MKLGDCATRIHVCDVVFLSSKLLKMHKVSLA
jgi:hypothetical protein